MSPQDDLNELLNGAVEVASELLASHSEFAPFALAMQPDGEVFHLEPEEEDLGLDPEQIVEALRGGLHKAAREGRWKAVAVVADVTVEDDEGEPMTAAIHISMEHGSADPVICTVPYAIQDEEVVLEELFAEPGETIVFRKDMVN
jgi:hypothetical protein